MHNRERREKPRYTMHYPVIISSVRALDSERGWHYGEIIDAGRTGVRMRVSGFGGLPAGTRLQLICQPVSGEQPNNKCMPVAIQGTVVWENPGTAEFGLTYSQ